MVKQKSPFDTTNRYDINLLENESEFCIPVEGHVVRGKDYRHDGVDISTDTGDTVRVAFDGKVRYAMYNTGGYGNLIIVRHMNGLETYYAHLSGFLCLPNQMFVPAIPSDWLAVPDIPKVLIFILSSGLWILHRSAGK